MARSARESQGASNDSFSFPPISIGITKAFGAVGQSSEDALYSECLRNPMQQQPPPSSLGPGKPATPEISNQPGKAGHPWIWLLLIVTVGFGAYYFWARSKSDQRAKGTVNPNMQPARAGGRTRGGGIPPVVAVKAYKGNIGVYVNGLGAVTPIYTVTVKSRVDGQLMQIHYEEGQFIHQGDPLAEIDPRPYQVQLAQAQGQIEKDKSTLENARIDLARYQELIVKHAVPETAATQKATVIQDEGTVKTDRGKYRQRETQPRLLPHHCPNHRPRRTSIN